MSSNTDHEARLEANKAIVRRILAKLSNGDIGSFISALAPDYVRHCQAMPPGLQELHGREAMHDWVVGI